MFCQHSTSLARIHRWTRLLSSQSNKRPVVGLVRETYGNWERRAPLSPDHVRVLTEERGVHVIVQPSSRRVFADSEYTAAGAEVSEDLEPSTVVLGVKQITIDNLLQGRPHLFFSHTIKAQEENMALLKACLDKNVTLIDYECIVNLDPESADKGKRLVAFGNYAGIVGMVDVLQGFGQRLLADGFSTPFLQAPLCYMQSSLSDVRARVNAVGESITSQGLPPDLGPVVFCFTGSGNVGAGAKAMFELLPHSIVRPQDLKALVEERGNSGERETQVYGCYLDAEHLVKRKDGGPFNKEEYYATPSLYESCFHQDIAPYCTVLMNGMYWDHRFPRLLTTDQMAALATSSSNQGKPCRPRLRAIADVTCDMGGSLEMCTRTTTFEQPYYEWDSFAKAEAGDRGQVGSSPHGVAVLAVDILPTALPRDASTHFGNCLLPILQELVNHLAAFPKGEASGAAQTSPSDAAAAASSPSSPSSDSPTHPMAPAPAVLPNVPPVLVPATIATQGALTGPFKYIEALAAQPPKTTQQAGGGAAAAAAVDGGGGADNEDLEEGQPSVSRLLQHWHRRVVLVQGHLFDSKFVNTAFDVIEKRGAFEILNFHVVPNMKMVARESQMVLGVCARDEAELQALIDDLNKLGSLLDVRLQELDAGTHFLKSGKSYGGGRPRSVAGEGAAGGQQQQQQGQGVMDRGAVGPGGGDGAAAVSQSGRRSVLLLGAGFVAAPLVDYLTCQSRDSPLRARQITVVSDCRSAASALAARSPGAATAVQLDIALNETGTTGTSSSSSGGVEGGADDAQRLEELIASADVVVSLLPPPFHPQIAKQCIRAGTHLVTASYVSPEMKALHSEAEAKGIVLLNEMGLDPGMDHMSAMKLIDEVKDSGGAVRSFTSVCGGLSSPEALAPDNPLQYAFTWSPQGVCTAALGPARFLEQGKVVEHSGGRKLQEAKPFNGFPSLSLESYANRDSLSFGDLYGIQDEAHTVFRGTLRFKGWCGLMRSFGLLGLFDKSEEATAALTPPSSGQQQQQQPFTWGSALNSLAAAKGCPTGPRDLLVNAYTSGLDGGIGAASRQEAEEEADRALACLTWLGAGPKHDLPLEDEGGGATSQGTRRRRSPFEVFVALLSEKLTPPSGGRDLVIMQHEFEFEWPSGASPPPLSSSQGADETYRAEKHTTSLIAFGDDRGTAMARTVGLTAAIGADLVLEGVLDDTPGVATPVAKEVYLPTLKRLEAEGFVFHERREPTG